MLCYSGRSEWCCGSWWRVVSIHILTLTTGTWLTSWSLDADCRSRHTVQMRCQLDFVVSVSRQFLFCLMLMIALSTALVMLICWSVNSVQLPLKQLIEVYRSSLFLLSFIVCFYFKTDSRMHCFLFLPRCIVCRVVFPMSVCPSVRPSVCNPDNITISLPYSIHTYLSPT